MAGRPVEIEFLMKDRNLTSGMNSAGQGADVLAQQAAYASRKLEGVDAALGSIDNKGRAIGATFKTFLGGAAMGAFVKHTFQIRSQMQDIESSMRVFLGDAEKARKFVAELKDYAWFNMFEFSDLAQESSNLLAFGNDIESIIPILDKLSNIASATGRPLSEIVELYNKAKSMGKVDAHGLESWARQGVVIMDVLKEMGIHIDRSSVKFEHLEMVLNHVTSEGGRFHGQMNERMQNLSASWGQLQDDLTNMFNEIGEKTQGIMKGTIEMGSELIDNYEAIGKTLGVLIATYGTYRASLIAIRAYEKASVNITYKAEIEELQKLIDAKQESASADLEQAVASGRITQAKADELIAIREAVAAKLTELQATQALAASELAEAAAAYKSALMKTSASRTLVSQREMELSLAKLSGDASQIELAQKALLEAQEERHIAVKARKATADQLSIMKSKEASATTAVETLQTKINTATTLAGAKAKNIFAVASQKVAAGLKSIKAAVVANPIGMALTAVMAITTAISFFSNKSKEAEENLTGLARASKNAGEQFDGEASKLKVLQEIINNGNIAYEQRRQALKELKDIIPGYNGQLDEEGRLINSNTEAIKEYLVQLEKQVRMKAVQEELEEAYRQQRQDLRDADNKIAGGADVYVQGFQGSQQKSGTREYTGEEAEAIRQRALAKTTGIIAELTGEMEKNAQAGKKNEASIKTFSDQLATAKDTVSTLKTELAELLAGKGDEADFATAIETKKKDLEAAEKRVNLLLGIDKTTTKNDKDKNRQKVEAAERARQIREYRDKVVDDITKAELDISQARIDVMDEGIDKEMAQIELNYEKLLFENKQRQDQMLKELQKAERQEWENKNPDYKDKGLVFESKLTVDNLTEEQKKVVKDYTDAANAYKTKAEEELLRKLLEKYGTYSQQKADIEEKYEKIISTFRTKGLEDNAKEAEKARDKEISALNKKVIEDSGLWTQLFTDFGNLSTSALTALFEQAEAEIRGATDLSMTDLQALNERLNEIRKELARRNPFSVLLDSYKKYQAARKAGDKQTADQEWEKVLAASGEAKNAIGDIGQSLSGLAGVFSEDLSSGINKAVSVIQNGITAFEAFGKSGEQSAGDTLKGINSLIGILTTVVGEIFNAIEHTRQYVEATKQSIRDFNREYEQLMLHRMVGDNDNIFGSRHFKNVSDNVKMAAEAIRKYRELISQEMDIPGFGDYDMGSQRKQQDAISRMKTALEAYAKGYNKLQSMSIKTKDYSGFANWLGFKDKYTNLKDLAPQLWDENGDFDVEAAKIFLETNKQITEEQRKQIEEVIALKESYDEAVEAIKSEIADTFGILGSAITDSIVEGIKNGTNAWDIFKDAGAKVLEDLGKKLMYELFFAKYFDKLEADLTEIYENDSDDPQTLGLRIQNLLGSFFAGMKDQMTGAEEWYKEWMEQAKKNGFDLMGGADQQSGRPGSFQTMSQDQGTKLEGLFTSAQLLLGNIEGKLDQVNLNLYDMSDNIAEIKENTGTTVKRLDTLLDQIKRIIRDGLKMK